MTSIMLAVALTLTGQTAEPDLKSGDRTRRFAFEGRTRMYHYHLPRGYDPKKPAPVVLVLHGAGTNGKIMELFCGMSSQADRGGFIVVYPSGTGIDPLLTWNAGSFPPGALNGKKPNDVAFLGKVLDDLATLVPVDAKRVYVAGLSNGGMMAFRASAEMSDRIAAMASVAGTLVTTPWQPTRPMPVLHIHGTEDGLVPFEGSMNKPLIKFPAIQEVMLTCAQANGCREKPVITELARPRDALKVQKHDYGKGKGGAEVILYVIEGGGHTWPGRFAPSLLGKTTFNLNTNETIWDFFAQYRRE